MGYHPIPPNKSHDHSHAARGVRAIFIMHPSILNRSFLRPAIFLAAIALIAPAATAGAAEPAPAAQPRIATVILSPDEAVQKELKELDRILDVNPKF